MGQQRRIGCAVIAFVAGFTVAMIIFGAAMFLWR
jgi:hypothetical protein